MIVLERCTLLGLYRLRRLWSVCSCRKVLSLSGGPLSRLLGRIIHARQFTAERAGQGRILASFLSVPITEAIVEQGMGDPRAAAALQAFWEDDRILLAYRKILAEWVEHAIAPWQVVLREAKAHGCEKITFVPVSRVSFQVMRCWRDLQREVPTHSIEIVDDRIGLGLAGLCSVLASWVVTLGLLGKVLDLLVRQGVSARRPRPKRYLVGLHNYWNMRKGQSWDLRSADFLVDGRGLAREDLLILISRNVRIEERQQQYSESGIPWASLFGPPVPVSYLLSFIPRLFKALLAIGTPSVYATPFLRRRTAGAVLYGLRLEIFLQHYVPGVLLSCEEHSHIHIVETVVANRFGGATAWIPHSICANTGYQTAYIHYDLFPSQGWFTAEAFGRSWSPQTKVRPVGIAANDGLALPEADIAGPGARRIVESAQGKLQIVAAFTGSHCEDEFVRERHRRFLTALAMLTERRKDVLVVVKPKASSEWPEHAEFLFEDPFAAILSPGVKAQQIVVLDPRKQQTCLAQYLMNAASLVLSTGQFAAFGSVWAEALLLGKPSLVFVPAEFRHAPFALEFFDRWFFDDEDKLVSCVMDHLKEPASGRVNDRMRHLFDPFGDGRAIERLRNEILALRVATA